MRSDSTIVIMTVGVSVCVRLSSTKADPHNGVYSPRSALLNKDRAGVRKGPRAGITGCGPSSPTTTTSNPRQQARYRPPCRYTKTAPRG